jgi:hypothetical protein
LDLKPTAFRPGLNTKRQRTSRSAAAIREVEACLLLPLFVDVLVQIPDCLVDVLERPRLQTLVSGLIDSMI